MDHETKHARKTLSWAGPILLIFVALCIWGIVREDIPTVIHLVSDAPVIRISAGTLATPFCVVAVIVTIIAVALKAVPVRGRVLDKFVRWSTISWIAAAVVLVTSLLLARPLQSYYVPKHGYTRCTLLDGNPTIWFTDWVKNPAWCVKGKRREWVFEQAAQSASQAPSSESK